LNYQNGEKFDEANVLLNLGLLFEKTGDLVKSKENLLKCVEISTQIQVNSYYYNYNFAEHEAASSSSHYTRKSEQ
jgi:hypothetical protein